MKVYILTEGGTKFGYGHIFRCSSLYDEVDRRGINVEFVINGDTDVVKVLKDKKHLIRNWLSVDFLTTIIDNDTYIIVDSYIADTDIYKFISSHAKKSLFIDDELRINYPKGIVVNPSINADNLNYPKENEKYYLLGVEYVILRRPFVGVKRTLINDEVKEVLITMGGSDIRGLTVTILKHLSNKYKNIAFNVVIGNGFENIDDVKRIKANNTNFYQNVNADEMKSIMMKSDIAITAAGQTIYELLTTQTPFIPIKVIDNQTNNIVGLSKYNLIGDSLDYNDNYLLEKIETELNKLFDYDKRKDISNLYGSVIDGLGSKRMIDKLIENSR